MSISRRSLLRAAALAAAMAAIFQPVRSSHAQAYPDHPVRVIVPFAAGGPTDTTARIVAQGLSEQLGQQFYVENIGGAGGNTGTVQAARATPDGYTLIVVSTGFVINPSLYATAPYDPQTDFTPITIACESPNVLLVNADVPAKTPKELIDLIKANPGQYNYAQPGTGSTGHLLAEIFGKHFDLDLVNIPFTGAAPAITSTIGGHTRIAWTALPPALSQIREGKLRALAVSGEKRNPQLPNVQTLGEIGLDVQGTEVLTAVLAPAGTPKPIVDRLYREIATLMAKPEVKEKLATLGFQPVANTPENYAARIDADVKRWGKVLKEAGIQSIK